MVGVLAIDPDYDPITKYFKVFRNKDVFHALSASSSIALLRAQGPGATRQAVDAHLSSGTDVLLISGAGHGLHDEFLGQHGQAIWVATEDLSHLNGKIVHLLSCHTAASLGREMILAGVEAFWGYTLEFILVHIDPPPRRLDEDWKAEACIKMDTTLLLGLLAADPADVIWDSVTRYVSAHRSDPRLTQSVRAAIVANYLHLVGPGAQLWGDPNATI